MYVKTLVNILSGPGEKLFFFMVDGSEYLLDGHVYVLGYFLRHTVQQSYIRVDNLFMRLSLFAKRTEIVCLTVLTWDSL